MALHIECATCLEKIAGEDEVVSLPCGHLFHYECIDQWFNKSKNCPTCRKDATRKEFRKIYFTESWDTESKENVGKQTGLQQQNAKPPLPQQQPLQQQQHDQHREHPMLQQQSLLPQQQPPLTQQQPPLTQQQPPHSSLH
eukprot:TRINITY_DN1132_c0_g1_i5.p1 TRINITY_DN1132_c0_g1~~TRINITY_DN1132_c0_g1_i5.p1  ORF type:complete len:140 (+),score=46.57 TRINITY_DN1132_c0_g1_i5:145-564(+)